MKAIILAAGKGERMGTETDQKPKCMVKYHNKSIINYTIDVMLAAGIKDILVIGGYKINILKSHLKNHNIKYIKNKEYSDTNMVYTLFCAESEMNDDLIISYSDIIYENSVLDQLLSNTNDFVVAVDKCWRELWELRMGDPLEDAESMKIDKDLNIMELGKSTNSYEDIQGQYIGLFKIRSAMLNTIKRYYKSLDRNQMYDGKNYNNMYMTSFIQLIIENITNVKAELINGGWLEFDNQNDMACYNKHSIKLNFI